MNMGMPSIDIIFQTAGQSFLRRGQAGTVAVILKDAAASGAVSLKDEKEIPTKLAADNQAYLARAFAGYVYKPKKVLCYVLAADALNLDAALDWLATQRFDYLAGPKTISPTECTEIVTWIKAQRVENHAIYKAVLPKTAADCEAVVNFTTEGIAVGEVFYSAGEYCSRIAGALAGTPLTYAASFAPLPEVQDVTRLTGVQMDAAVDAGGLLAFWDGLRVKLGRAVNSLQTLTGKSADYKKIKIIEVMDLIQSDLRQTFASDWIGRYTNSYDNKILLLTAVKLYFQELEAAGILQAGSGVELDLEAQRAYLQAHGGNPSEMTNAEILHAGTGSHVFLTAGVKILDAIEDIRLTIGI